MLSSSPDIAPAMVVGRVLSSYTVPGIQNDQETITLTVYNEQSDPETGVLLTDKLAAGVTMASSSQTPDQSGQDLAWSLGTIAGFDRASVTVTLHLPTPTPLQLDTGAQAYATLDAGAVTAATTPATLNPSALDPTLLASTPDANITDPFIQEEAAALDYNAQNIFIFLHSEIGYNAYVGSVRGARGTLWSAAGNSLDVASLGVALMRASGIPAQYVSGTLSQNLAEELILTMFPASDQTVGYIAAGTPVADPANDPTLLAETESHTWFQFNSGSGMQDADPLMPGATIGHAFATSPTTFATVPDSLREKTDVQLVAEITNTADSLFGVSGQQDTTVLDQTFNDVDLVGRPLTIGSVVTNATLGSVITETINTYSPYIEEGDEAYPPSTDSIMQGTPFQETLTNFPDGSEVLTSLFLNVTLSGPQGASETFSRSLVDLIGFAARQQGGTSTVSANASGQPAINSYDLTTLDILASATNPIPSAALDAELAQDSAQIAAASASNPPADLGALLTGVENGMNRLLADEVIDQSQYTTRTQANEADVVAYFDRPRIVMVTTRDTLDSTTNTDNMTSSIDLVNDSLHVIAAPGQTEIAPDEFNLARGLFENIEEQQVIAGLAAATGQTLQVDNTAVVFQTAAAQGISLSLITSASLGTLDGLGAPGGSQGADHGRRRAGTGRHHARSDRDAQRHRHDRLVRRQPGHRRADRSHAGRRARSPRRIHLARTGSPRTGGAVVPPGGHHRGDHLRPAPVHRVSVESPRRQPPARAGSARDRQNRGGRGRTRGVRVVRGPGGRDHGVLDQPRVSQLPVGRGHPLQDEPAGHGATHAGGGPAGRADLDQCGARADLPEQYGRVDGDGRRYDGGRHDPGNGLLSERRGLVERVERGVVDERDQRASSPTL